uniref:Translocon-associated protein subunit beta n=1 Tax=Caenorhabditis tropicalis TaxID=1561998 RepID=A0A1I7TYE4_9PELO
MRPPTVPLHFALLSSAIFWCSPCNNHLLLQTHIDLTLMANKEGDKAVLYELVTVGSDFDHYLSLKPTAIESIRVLEIKKFEADEIILFAVFTEYNTDSTEQRVYFVKLFLVPNHQSPTGYIIV